jgi:hypothetical protein
MQPNSLVAGYRRLSPAFRAVRRPETAMDEARTVVITRQHDTASFDVLSSLIIHLPLVYCPS